MGETRYYKNEHGEVFAYSPIQDVPAGLAPLTPDEVRAHLEREPSVKELWDAVRAERNTRLAACDWTQLPDVPLTEEQRAAWQQYRQDLRDVPQQPGAPWDVTWPEPPGPVAQ